MFENKSDLDSEDDQVMDEENAQYKNTDASRQCIHVESSSSLKFACKNLSKEQWDGSGEELLNLCGLEFKDLSEIEMKISKRKNLKSIHLHSCLISSSDNKTLDPIDSLECVTLNNCSDNIFKIFKAQNALVKITVINDKWTWNGFPHETFNEICKNSKNLNHLVLDGAGTGSYFECGEYPYQIKKLDTSMITFHWYVGIKSPRVNFLQSQKGSLKELTIHQLPHDFDGGDVIKYIIEEMDLEKFYYGDIPLIINGRMQKIKELMASEVQITSAYEIAKHFSIEKLTLKLTTTDVSSDEIEKIINPPTDVFNNIKEFKVIDNSSSRGLFTVFCGLYTNLKNISKLTLITKDINLYKVLKYLPIMSNLKEIVSISTAPRILEKYHKFAPNLKIIKVQNENVREVQNMVGDNVVVAPIDLAHVQQGNEGGQPRRRDGGGDGDDDNDQDDDDDGDEEDDENRDLDGTNVLPKHGKVEEKSENFQFRSDYENSDVNNFLKVFVHAYGYAGNILIRKNSVEIIRLIKNEAFYTHIISTRIEQNKFVAEFQSNNSNYSNQFKNRMNELAFRPHNSNYQLPLLTLSRNVQIQVFCHMNKNIEWNMFRHFLSLPNGLNGSLWRHQETVPAENQTFRTMFMVDPITYFKILGKRNILNYRGTDVLITAIDNTLLMDMNNLPE